MSLGAVLYSVALAAVAAAIIGVLPGLKATGRRVRAGLQQFSARGAGLRLGGTWTALIVLQVAVAVGALPATLYNAGSGFRVGMRRPAPAAAPLLRATLDMSRENSSTTRDGSATTQDLALFTARMTALLEKLRAEPGVAAVTYADRFAGEERFAPFEVETDGQPITFRVGLNRVATNLFEVLDVPVLAGRGFTNADAHPSAQAAIVDQAFADRLGGNVLGRRVRYVIPSRDGPVERGPWHEIVGVVPAFAYTIAPPVGISPPSPRLYLAGRPGDNLPATVIVKVNSGDPTHLSLRLREISASVHPTLRLDRLVGVVEEFDHSRQAMWYVAPGVLAVTASVVLLSAAGIYAMMSFTVAKRRREIGIRAALGADARRVLIGIFGRAAAQIGAGVAAGLAIAAVLARLGDDGGSLMGGKEHVLLPTVAGLMFIVGILAALGPARRGLAVQPTEALREE
jgi:cell division protein FtsX